MPAFILPLLPLSQLRLHSQDLHLGVPEPFLHLAEIPHTAIWDGSFWLWLQCKLMMESGNNIVMSWTVSPTNFLLAQTCKKEIRDRGYNSDVPFVHPLSSVPNFQLSLAQMRKQRMDLGSASQCPWSLGPGFREVTTLPRPMPFPSFSPYYSLRVRDEGKPGLAAPTMCAWVAELGGSTLVLVTLGSLRKKNKSWKA